MEMIELKNEAMEKNFFKSLGEFNGKMEVTKNELAARSIESIQSKQQRENRVKNI